VKTEFAMGTRVVAGLGTVALLDGELARLASGPVASGPVAVVADAGVAAAGLLEEVLGPVAGAELVRCPPVDPNPDVAAAERLVEVARAAGARSVLGIGGGSALCAAKAVAVRLNNDGDLRAWEGRDRLPTAPAPSIAIPTTAGSGSEVSNALVLHDPGYERQLAIRGVGYEPHVAILDGTMLSSLPRRAMIEAALDALSHALEALWAVGGSSFTDALALDAAATIQASLIPALERDPNAMQRLIEASAAANMACGSAGLGVVHALSSSPAVHLPHGYQNGVLLTHAARFNRQAVRRREGLALIDSVPDLYASIGFSDRFAGGDLSESDAAAMLVAARSNPFRANNARPVSERDLLDLLSQAGAPAPAAAIPAR
jgi:alcohol dehydrogenase class IV